MKIGILNSGGDVQGLNAVIASAVKYGKKFGMDFIGFQKGWEGILDMDYIDLPLERVRGISHLGGTILKSVNKGRFAGKVGEGDLNKIPTEILNLAKTNLEKLEVEALIVMGGDGTLSAAMQLAEVGVKIIGVPKTIDNDLMLTDKTFGFSTAVDIVVEALDRVHTTAVSHDRVMIVETMGRHVGWIALKSGLAGGANMILLPEIPYSTERIVEFLRRRKEMGLRYSIIVAAEGATPAGGSVYTKDGERPEVVLGGISEHLAKQIEAVSNKEFECRNVVLGHIQRGGAPSAEDRIISKSYGVAAVDAIVNKQFGMMVALQDNKIVTVPISEAVKELKKVDFDCLPFQTAKKIGISFGD